MWEYFWEIVLYSTVFIIILFSIIPIFEALSEFGSGAERKLWNKGIDPISGEPWIPFDTDSQGNMGFKSSAMVENPLNKGMMMTASIIWVHRTVTREK